MSSGPPLIPVSTTASLQQRNLTATHYTVCDDVPSPSFAYISGPAEVTIASWRQRGATELGELDPGTKDRTGSKVNIPETCGRVLEVKFVQGGRVGECSLVVTGVGWIYIFNDVGTLSLLDLNLRNVFPGSDQDRAVFGRGIAEFGSGGGRHIAIGTSEGSLLDIALPQPASKSQPSAYSSKPFFAGIRASKDIDSAIWDVASLPHSTSAEAKGTDDLLAIAVDNGTVYIVRVKSKVTGGGGLVCLAQLEGDRLSPPTTLSCLSLSALTILCIAYPTGILKVCSIQKQTKECADNESLVFTAEILLSGHAGWISAVDSIHTADRESGYLASCSEDDIVTVWQVTTEVSSAGEHQREVKIALSTATRIRNRMLTGIQLVLPRLQNDMHAITAAVTAFGMNEIYLIHGK